MAEAGVASSSLALGSITAPSDAVAARALTWWRGLDALGVSLPLVVVHDLGLCLALPDREILAGRRAELTGDDERRARGLAALIDGVRETLTRERLVALAPRDELLIAAMAALLHRHDTGHALPPCSPSELLAGSDELAVMWSGAPRALVRRTIDALLEDAPALLTRLDALDVDTLRLSARMGRDAVATLVAALEQPQAELISRMTLDVVPAALGRRRPRGARAEEHGGVLGIGLRGELGALLASELAWDDDELTRRLLLDEALYSTREAPARPEPVRHVIAVDASAAMRGDRAVLARALCLSLAARLREGGDEVVIRFFDARLYEPILVGAALPVAEVASFSGEQGRDVGRALDALACELGARRGRAGAGVEAHLVTHGATVVPRAVVSRLLAVAALHVTRVGAADDAPPTWVEQATSASVVSLSDAGDPARAAARIVELVSTPRPRATRSAPP
ncbi:MAG: hypothetical protein IT374_08615 [Polyangiaceae bacterium]|nr:hypothetical protein [Polyangiaceae bacterium]